MSTAPVMSITDELIAELEAATMAAEGSGESWYTADSVSRFPMFAADKAIVVLASPAVIRALLTERAGLKRDAEQRQWVPVGERSPVYPDKGKCYVMGLERGNPHPFPVRYTPSRWEYMDGDTCRRLTHWMPALALPGSAQ